MKRMVMAGFTAAMMALGGMTLAEPGNAAAPRSQMTGHVLVKFRDSGAAGTALQSYGLKGGAGIGSTGAQLVQVPAGKEQQLIEALSRNPAVEYAESDELATVATADQYFPGQYALQNDGQSFTSTGGTLTVEGGKADADVDAVEAWDVTTGNGTKVAIVDTGVASDNPDISPKVVARANFSDSPTAEDLYGHGTHVAGIVAATADNTLGVAGVCPACTILDAKVLNDDGTGSTSRIAEGIDWAVSNGAQVINMSLGLGVPSRTLETAVNNAWKHGVVIVAAAGNAGTQAKVYPGAYSNVIAVAATDNADAKAPFSTYGKWVDVAAPGVNIYSTFPNHPFQLGADGRRSQGYDVESGTSMASPVVAGVAALAWSAHADATNKSVRADLESTADEISGTGTAWAHGRVNANNAVRQ
ncbi:thermitase [Arthrobacter sp. B3I9]|uniref:S8 family serine peptidase n=1 Tax=Arthrobacter sp. B3I9 TaxID=3042270 RepID=UPI002790F6E3|nr:S8 family serine peptidase [Arthrobacter sp. B3I9]MDQ0851273.1 thermitase [Arthrobacter sp. B3I9]